MEQAVEQNHVADVNIENIYVVDYLYAINKVIDDLGVVEMFDELIPHDKERCKLTPGQVVKFLILDSSTGKLPLVHMEPWAGRLDLEKLFGPGVKASYFNDDAIARTLDRIHKAGAHMLFSSLLLRVYRILGNRLNVFHADTTSRSVYGSYNNQAKDADFKITEGYSKDNRQGDKQFGYGVVVNKDNIMICGSVHSGNTSDKEWNVKAITNLRKQLDSLDMSSFVYIADSAAFSKETLDNVKKANGYLISRGGKNLKIVKKALELADSRPNYWSKYVQIGQSNKNAARYRVQEVESKYKGHRVRLVVVESSSLRDRKAKSVDKHINKEQIVIQRTQKKWSKAAFNCYKDAEEAVKKWLKENKICYHSVSYRITKVAEPVKRNKVGRPKKDEKREFLERYYIVIDNVELREDYIAWKIRKGSLFVLIATVPKEYQGEKVDSLDILRMYKEQHIVETNFSVLKDPVFADEVYLKKPERIKAYGYVQLIALCIYNVLQYRLRKALKGQAPLRGAAGRKITNPTGRAIFRMFLGVTVVVIRLPDGTRIKKLLRPFTEDQRRVNEALGLSDFAYT